MVGPASESVRGGLPGSVISLDQVTVMQSYLGAPVNFIKLTVFELDLLSCETQFKFKNCEFINIQSAFSISEPTVPTVWPDDENS